MRNSNSADFLLTGMVVLWPALLWAGDYELGVLAFAFLLYAIWICGMLTEADDGRRERDPMRDADARDRS
jgi:hypothetical protein